MKRRSRNTSSQTHQTSTLENNFNYFSNSACTFVEALTRFSIHEAPHISPLHGRVKHADRHARTIHSTCQMRDKPLSSHQSHTAVTKICRLRKKSDEPSDTFVNRTGRCRWCATVIKTTPHGTEGYLHPEGTNTGIT